ncbi:pyruvate:ferredoxin (flavodoxin) oxidoreductase [Thiolapillus brandeum]|uniref:Pyruvate-flavodoxin oxidoreductase n=1 Tax=Thiolapillus brandeum TaxID=1076588 RepID=A0A7U6GHI5_9GAMM|nr:pyruvate:ferredoxin (flavodoxin) oxidoreductase [Thiolapillus brandeum]BAO43740.1 pyruvate-flavodoxin oxidoreductase [Thiolapillus brandeum]
MTAKKITLDGNQAAAHIAHKTNEVIAIYPITPASPMGEFSDEWSAQGKKNIWGGIPEIIEMQSEGGASGAVHGAVQAGALTTTFTASQGLLLMIPNMYKIAGELSPVVIHVAARSLAAQALSIFGDHSDVMATRATGFAMLASCSVQEAMDMALISQAATLRGHLPFVHFFDGFRTSHELMKVDLVDDETIRSMISNECLVEHRQRALTPDRPVLRGTSQNPDVYFQGRETVNPWYAKLPQVVQDCMDEFARLTGRQYRLFDYFGASDAERVIILMGSGAEAVEETVEHLLGESEKVGLLRVRLYRPFSAEHLLEALPASVQALAVLDRCKEPGAGGEPLYKDVVTAFAEHVAAGGEKFASLPRILGGRYGLSSKEFTPGMIRAVFDNLRAEVPKNHFTIGIHDDVSHTSLEWDHQARNKDLQGVIQCLFYGLGSDGTVSANKNTLKIIGEETDQFVQGYFVYDSKKAGAVTVSHLRFSSRPIRASYLIEDGQASFIGCHQPQFVERFNLLEKAAPGAVLLLNTATPPDEVWRNLPRPMQKEMLEKGIKLWVIDAYKVARETGMGRRINTIMQTCFFAISGVLPRDEAIDKIKNAVEKTYGRKGRKIVQRNFDAIDASLASLHQVSLPDTADSSLDFLPPVPAQAPDFVQKVTATLIAGKGDDLPVSAIPADGSWPLGTAAWEKRSIALELPKWDAELCIECGKCPFVCPHSAIRSKVFTEEALKDAPEGFLYRPMKGKEFAGLYVTYQVAPDDCTGCSLCADVCPARDKSNASHKSLDMVPKEEILEQDRINWAFFEQLPEYDREKIAWPKMKSAMLAQPLFEFSGACLGCGETPYIRLATQMFGDRMLVANATGCSSIYGGNLPTTPYTTNPNGRGPAWSNSLFEDNAEFGLGFRLAVDQHRHQAEVLLAQLGDALDQELVREILSADQSDEPGIHQQRQRVETLKAELAKLDRDKARRLLSIADYLVKKSVWIIGGDGWAYDIGFGGLDHALASGKDINLLVLDTEVYSNTGGQTSKATPRGAVAKFSAAGKAAPKKDLGMIAMAYENVYVASVSSGAKDVHTLKALMEAESYPGPSIILAYSPCIAHGVDMSFNLRQQKLAINSGHWPLYRYDPRRREKGLNPLQLDYKKPSVPLKEYYQTETRFAMLWRSHPQEAEAFLAQQQEAVLERYIHLEQLASLPVEEAEESAL